MQRALAEEISEAAEKWKDWNSSQKSQIEPTIQASVEAREQSLAARKDLADATKQFKKSVKTLSQTGSSLDAALTPENASMTVQAVDKVTRDAKLIVNSYKEEIDNLTNRCKSMETAYASLAQTLRDLPDPASVFASCGQEMLKSKAPQPSGGLSSQEQDELADLRREVAEYEAEFRSLKNQDITIRKLEGRIVELQAAAEEELHEQLLKAREELIDTEGHRAAEALEREASMARKVQKLELELKAERAGREATQTHLLEADEGVSQREAAWEAQRQIFTDDLERLREIVQITTREKDELQLKMAALKEKSTSAPYGGTLVDDLILERDAYEAEVAELAETANLLREELRRKDDELTDEKRSWKANTDAYEREKSQMQLQINSMQQDLASAPSPQLVETMKRELRILKRLEYNADTDQNPEIAGNQDDVTDLESVLVSKLKKAESELVTERVGREEFEKECTSLQTRLAEAEKRQKEQETLLTTLEGDLARAITAPVPPPAIRGLILSQSENSEILQSVLDPTTEKGSSKPLSIASKTLSERVEDDHSVATIVMAQRDRLRERCEALEAERDSFKRELQAQVCAADSLKTDNTKLYEKVRYLQNFSIKSNSGHKVDQDMDLEALEQRYEASVDPFRQFSRAERQRKLNEMPPMERTVFVVAKTVLATREMRTALFFYVVVLHFLVFATTYHWSHADECSTMNFDHLAHLPPNAPEHIRADFKSSNGDKQG